MRSHILAAAALAASAAVTAPASAQDIGIRTIIHNLAGFEAQFKTSPAGRAYAACIRENGGYAAGASVCRAEETAVIFYNGRIQGIPARHVRPLLPRVRPRFALAARLFFEGRG